MTCARRWTSIWSPTSPAPGRGWAWRSSRARSAVCPATWKRACAGIRSAWRRRPPASKPRSFHDYLAERLPAGHQRAVRREEPDRGRPRARHRLPLREARAAAEHLGGASAGAARGRRGSSRQRGSGDLPRVLRTRRRHRQTSTCWRELGAEAGLSDKTLQAFRETREGDAALVGSEERLRGFGVRTVPNLLFGGRVLVPGTVNVATYVHALDQALFPVSDEDSEGKADAAVMPRAAPPFWRLPAGGATLAAACRRPISRRSSRHRRRPGHARRRRGARARQRAISWPRRCRTAGASTHHRAGVRDPAGCAMRAARRSSPTAGSPGLVQGADADRSDIVLSLESMNAIERVDVPGPLVACAGGREARAACSAQAEEHGLVFPLDLGARDSCHGRRQHLDQCRRPARAALRHDAQPRARHRGGARGRHGAHLAQSHAQEQCRLRPQAVVHRQRRHARRRDARGAAAGVAHAQPGDAAGVAAQLRCHGRIAGPPRFRPGRATRRLRGAVGQLLRLQHRAAGAERGAAAARRAVLRHRGNTGRRSGCRPRAARSGARRGARGGRGERRGASRIPRTSGAPSGRSARTSGRCRTSRPCSPST